MKKILLLDGGHGIDTQGKSSIERVAVLPENFTSRTGTPLQVAKMYENEFNDAIVNKISAFVYQMRIEGQEIDSFIVSQEFHDVDMSVRTQRANEIAENNPDALCIYLSIHADAFQNPMANGFTIFKHPQSGAITNALANHLHIAVKVHHTSYGIVSRHIRTANFEVLRDTNMAAILIESGFMTNPNDLRTLMNERFRNSYALALTKAIVSFQV